MKKLLFLEDDNDVAETVLKILRHSAVAVEVRRARTVNEGIHALLADNFNFDAALLDYSLPDGFGTTLMETLRRKMPRCKVIVYSSHIGTGDDSEGLIRRQAPDFMLSKPFDISEFRKIFADVGLC